MGIEDFLDGPVNEEPAVPPVEPTPVEPEPQPEVPEAPHEPEVPAEPTPQEESRHVPLATFLDQRDKAKAADRRAELAEAELARMRTEPAKTPDPFDDPQGYAAHQDARMNEALVAQRFQISEVIAKQHYGAEAVEAASAWATQRAKENQGFAVSYMQQPHPIDWIVQQHKRDQLMSQIGDDPDEYVRRRYAELNPTPAPSAAPVAAPQQPASVPPPPRSLASLPGNGGGVQAVPVGPLAATDAVFQR